MKMKFRSFSIFALLSLALGASLSLQATKPPKSGASVRQPGDFFIVSSVEVGKSQIVLKLPTEVTELMKVTEATIFLNEQGKPMQFRELRAGDTVYVVSKKAPDGTHTALRIRRGPMTADELRRRYLSAIIPAGL
jgi:hypothetical protein